MGESEEARLIHWFGDLNLAFKYSLIFGGLLVITVILGVFKLIVDKRRMNKFIRDMESEAAEKALSAENDETELNMREKDEGDLFGIRAIEAGFYGGVHQSRPASAAATPLPSRPTSPSFGGSKPSTYAPSLASQSTVYGGGNGNSKHLADTRSFSATSSTLSQGQFRDPQSPTYRIPSNAPPQLRSHSAHTFDRAQFRVPSHASESSIPRTTSPASDSRFRYASPASSDPNLPSIPARVQRDLPALPALRLAPSQAELNGRLKHTMVDMSAEVPPSPISEQQSSSKQRKAPPSSIDTSSLRPTALHPGPISPRSPRSPRSPKSPKSPRHLMPPTPGKDSSRISQISTSTYYPESTYGDAEPPTMRMNQDHTGHLTVVKAHMSSAVSMHGSIDEDREQDLENQEQSVPMLPPLSLSSRPSTAKERAHDSTSTFADLEDYFARQAHLSARPRSAATATSAAVSQYEEEEEEEEYSEDDQSNYGSQYRATSSLAASNRTSLASEYPERRNLKLVQPKIRKPLVDTRQPWTARVRLPTGAPF